MTLKDTVSLAFKEKFGEAPKFIVRAPGRVNLIGEHTDYNDGFVMPMALNRAMWIALRPTDSPTVNIYSLDFDEQIAFALDNFTKGKASPAEYVKGMAWALQEAGYTLNSWEGVMQGDVPIGAGLSSSAALELAVARAFNAVSNFEWHPAKIALLAQKCENQWVGVSTGIMDQMISASGKEGHALLIDCRSLETEAIPVPDGTAVVVLDTGTRRELVTSAYNERRQQCETAARYFGVRALRDVTYEQFEAGKAGLDDVVMRRAKHVISENERVMRAKQAMVNGNAAELGKILIAGHASLRDDFEVSGDALNAIVEVANEHAACYGARMTGGGFAGCAVALVDATQVDSFVEGVTEKYTQRTLHIPTIYVSYATNGAEIVE
jgi:galactokinase